MHNRHLPQLQNWRAMFALHARELAGLVKTFPGAENLDEETIYQKFLARTGLPTDSKGNGVFLPWTNTWRGEWSNGTQQFHVWDQPQYCSGQWIQLVTQSETKFSWRQNFEQMLTQHQVDLGINVCTPDTGITGWVSKWQHERLEVPHIGYLVEPNIMIWIGQAQNPDRLFPSNENWLIFLESVEVVRFSARTSVTLVITN